MEPVLQWPGGKRSILDSIMSRVPYNYENYHEPMIGGGALFFKLEPSKGSINDINPRLVNFYKQIRDNPREVIEKLETYKTPFSDPDKDRDFSDKRRDGSKVSNYYYQQREIFNKRPNEENYDKVEEAALLLYLNRTCYNALYRENQKGEFNTPIGSSENPDWNPKSRILKVSPLLDKIEIRNEDFDYILEEAYESDFVYFDPPYKPMSSSSDFVEYTKSGFGKEDQERLLDVVSKLSSKNVKVMISNSGVMFEKYNSRDLQVSKVDSPRPINSDPTNRGEVEEILATNYKTQHKISDF